MPVSSHSTLEQWKEFVKSFPVKIKEVTISGGEPTLYPDFVELVNWLLDEGYHVKVFTNLSGNAKLSELKRSYKLIIKATCHTWTGMPGEWFKNLYHEVKKRHRIDAFEIGDKKMLDFTELKPLITEEEGIETRYFRVTPDRRLVIGCLCLLK
jgi:MoaA/NifB/PqqE/SkfB family radical SAM enzyme